MRGVWIATVANIDWPSSKTLTADQQRVELADLMSRAANAGFNAIILQVRPAGDAVYQSDIEPWAALLTGTQGKSPGYDPLEFAIQEAHTRGLELHAWINPFRAGNTSDTLVLAPTHVFKSRRELVRIYGGNIWSDPGEPDVQDRAMAVISDIVRRYDVDAIHADDYFYPYVVNDAAGKPLAFPDSSTYAKYGAGAALDDWRRQNINRFVERMYREVHAIKPTVKVGISPFGIWRPGNPPSVQGLDAYASIYADSRKWLNQGWLDYFAPQLYWAIGAPQQSFPALLDWWISQNTFNRHIWPGIAAYRVSDGTASAFSANELPSQVTMTRERSGASGELFYNAQSTLKKNSGAIANTFAANLYAKRALIPAFPWLDATPPGPPAIAVANSSATLVPGSGESVRWWAIRSHVPGAWTTRIQFGTATTFAITSDTDRILVQAVDNAGNLSSAAEWTR
jgi:uncharacterized lipoprotein YddW (UPF0748 family)